MKIGSKIILIVSVVFVIGIFYWALYSPKQDMSSRIYETLKDQEKKADFSFKGVTFEEVVAGVKYWQLLADSASVNKSTGIAVLKDCQGTFFKKGRPALCFRSPTALWNMKKKEILLDKPIGYDVKLETRISALVKTLKSSDLSVFNLPQLYKKEAGYWFKAKNLSWKLADESLLCTGGIVLNKGEATGYAEKLEGDVALERVILDGKPKVSISSRDSAPTTVESDAFEILSRENLIIAKGNPRITWGEALVLTDALKYRQAERTLDLSGNVKINYKDIIAYGDSAYYLIDEGKIVLKGSARAEQLTNKLSGEQVSVSLKDRKISVAGRGKVIINE